jgi:glutamine---fructose-6-phosphate transaminase (isomerizing)
MCGIFGYIGKKNALTICLRGIKQLEYRGYDSAGVASIKNGKIHICKEKGKIIKLEEKIKLSDLNLEFAIGHTRWATHGLPTKTNAHPHIDSKNTLAVIHNGIIENHLQIKEDLQKKGYEFQTQTDTEVIAQLLSYHYKNNFIDALKKTIKDLTGSFALGIVHVDYPNQIFAASRESPLSIGYNNDKTEMMLSSDPNAFYGYDLNISFLKNDEIAHISPKKIDIFDQNLNKITKETYQLDGAKITPTKGKFDHFMLKEIYEQPSTIQKAMLGRYQEEFGTAIFDQLNFTSQELMSTKHILIIACGTSWHAGCIAASLLEDMARIPTQAEIASELRYRNPIISNETLVIAISQSGETADTLAAVKEAKAKGAKVLGICNVKNSTLIRESDSCIYLNAGPELSVCSTKAFTSQITVLTLFSLLMARLRHLSKNDGKIIIKELKKIPQKVKEILKQEKQIRKLAEKYSKYDNFFFLGRRHMYPTCLEAALKLKEISYLNANGYPAGELKHGPIALLSDKFPVIAFLANNQTIEKTLSNLMEVKARNAPLLAFAPIGCEEIKEIADDVFYLPKTIDELSTLLSSVAGQIFAYYVARKRGTDIDQPRNLAKSVTVE